MLDKLFKLQAHGTTVRTEVIAGITTFLTMAYIIFVNPNVLAKTGMDHGAVFVATCIAAAIGSFIMGFYANLPVALAPGMGLNAFFTYTVVLQLGHTWQTALACVFFSGVLFIIVSLLRIREWLINAIPNALKKSIAAGIGGFLVAISFVGAASGCISPFEGRIFCAACRAAEAPRMAAGRARYSARAASRASAQTAYSMPLISPACAWGRRSSSSPTQRLTREASSSVNRRSRFWRFSDCFS